ncbi:hypothetical protein LCGC14_0362180 [marine sediment metagenome]|uniref:Uncharacterized protein n=1 Tax=marine sediment metagenome TaxID=412755 RepID=A0A0F9T7Q1_9ZZZZ
MSFTTVALIGAGATLGAAALNKGGGGGGGGGFSQQPTLTPNQKELLNNLIAGIQGGAFPGGQLGGITPFGGQRVAGFGQLQQQGLGLAGGLGQGIGQGFDIFGQQLAQFDPNLGGQFLGQGADFLTQAGQGLDPQRILDALEPGRQLALNTFEQDIVPFLGERFGATSGASGAFNKALAEAGANLSLGVGAQAAPFLGQAALQQPGLDLSAAGRAGEFAQLPGQLALQGGQIGSQGTDLLSQLLNFGGLQQRQEQAGLGAAQQFFQEQQPFNNPFLNLLGPALGTQAFQTSFQQPAPGLGSQLLPALGAFAGSGGFGNLGFGQTPLQNNQLFQPNSPTGINPANVFNLQRNFG